MFDYDAFNKTVFACVPLNAVNILDVGCGTGIMGKVLKERNANTTVSGLTYSIPERDIAIQVIDKVWVVDVNQSIPDFGDTYDCIILSHILEHTHYPQKVLNTVSSYLKPGGVVIVALPNVLQFKQRFKFLKGDFKYSTHGGLMDDTHFRFFDWDTAQSLITNAGLKIVSKQSEGNFPLLSFFRKILPALASHIDKKVVATWPGLFGFQFVFTAVKA